MHHLNFEKVVDKIKSKYEAVVRMSVKAREIADSGMAVTPDHELKVTTMALNEYLKENHIEELQEELAASPKQEG